MKKIALIVLTSCFLVSLKTNTITPAAINSINMATTTININNIHLACANYPTNMANQPDTTEHLLLSGMGTLLGYQAFLLGLSGVDNGLFTSTPIFKLALITSAGMAFVATQLATKVVAEEYSERIMKRVQHLSPMAQINFAHAFSGTDF